MRKIHPKSRSEKRRGGLLPEVDVAFYVGIIAFMWLGFKTGLRGTSLFMMVAYGCIGSSKRSHDVLLSTFEQ